MEIKIDSLNQLEKLLNDNGIETAKWGLGKSKSIFALYREILEGETKLSFIDGVLTRELHVVGIVVTCGDYLLKEEKQVFTDGRARYRELTSSCTEKMIEGETPKEAAVRCLKEEIGIDVHETELTAKVSHTTEDISSSYPGLKSIYYRNPFSYEMKPELFKEEGYQEFQDDKTTYFIWVKQ